MAMKTDHFNQPEQLELVERHRPGVHENHLDIEDDKEHGYGCKTNWDTCPWLLRAGLYHTHKGLIFEGVGFLGPRIVDSASKGSDHYQSDDRKNRNEEIFRHLVKSLQS